MIWGIWKKKLWLLEVTRTKWARLNGTPVTRNYLLVVVSNKYNYMSNFPIFQFFFFLSIQLNSYPLAILFANTEGSESANTWGDTCSISLYKYKYNYKLWLLQVTRTNWARLNCTPSLEIALLVVVSNEYNYMCKHKYKYNCVISKDVYIVNVIDILVFFSTSTGKE